VAACRDWPEKTGQGVAYAEDGVVEVFERQFHLVQAGYQFHPEAERLTDARYQRLFQHLVDDAESYTQPL
jgi:gamma-glutamyl-gamma-aminobutyrate hydrolase PuuD